MHGLLLLALLACGTKDEPDSGTEPSSSTEPEPKGSVLAFRDAVQAAGWTVGRGAFTTSSMAFCCEAVVVCLETDPAVPYGTYALPPAPDQVDEDRDRYWMWGEGPPLGTSRDYRLRPDEAVVWIGTVPPASDYVGFRTMLSTREDEYVARRWVLGGAGRPLNQTVMASERGIALDALWGQPLVVVTAADEHVEQQVIDWLIEAGYPREQVHTDRLAATGLRMGLDSHADSFVSLVQVVDPVDPEALAAWRAEGATVLRLSPDAAPDAAPFGRPLLPTRGDGTTEAAYSAALDDLVQAVRDTYAPAPGIAGAIDWFDHPTFDCWDSMRCKGDTLDRLRAQSVPLTLEGANFAVAMGVNHVRTGKSAASTLAAHRDARGTALNWLTDEDLVGSARPFLGDSYPLVDDLYAVILARSCTPWLTTCLEIPPMCPSVPADEEMEVMFTDYLDPATGVGPEPTELELPRMLKFFPELP